MTEEDVIDVMKRTGALITNDHLIYTSGRHGSTYINKDAIFPHTKEISALCRELAGRFAHDQVHVIIAPAVGGVILSQWTAHHLSSLTGTEVLALYAEKTQDGKGFMITRGHDAFIPGNRILVVEDNLTTGSSVLKVINAVREHEGNVIGLGALCNRGGVTAADVGDIPKLEALVNLNLDSWAAQECPLCKQGIPINTKLGKGKNLVEATPLQS
ncbi:MAG TPA: phosphoribosyltransferase family protein [Candidatus Paceibacterota bacterium]|nr:phosphoribosyltransferase family protein [Candidatus Paceibacterota bacterium]